MSKIIDLDKFRNRKKYSEEPDGPSLPRLHHQTNQLVDEILYNLEIIMLREAIPANHPNCITIRQLLEEMIDAKLKIRDEEMAADLEFTNQDNWGVFVLTEDEYNSALHINKQAPSQIVQLYNFNETLNSGPNDDNK